MKKLILPFSLILIFVAGLILVILWKTPTLPTPKTSQPTPTLVSTKSIEISQVQLIKEIQAPDDVNDLKLSSDKKLLFIASQDESKVYVIDTKDDLVLKEINSPFPFSVAISPDDKFLYVSGGSQTIEIFEVKDFEKIKEIKVGTKPYAMTFSLDGKRLYVTNTESDNLSVIDTQTLTVLANVPVGKSPRGISLDSTGNFLYVTNYDDSSVSVVSTDSLTEVAEIIVGGRPNEILAHPSKNLLYVTDSYSNQILVIGASLNEVVEKIDVDEFPYGLEIDQEGQKLYVAGFSKNTISVVNLSNNLLEQTITTAGAFVTKSGFNKLALVEDLKKFYFVNTLNGKVLVYSY